MISYLKKNSLVWKEYGDMKVAVISDIHGNYTALNAVVNDMSMKGIDKVIILGDLVAKGPNPNEVVELIKTLDTVAIIKGNTDLWVDADISKWKPKNINELIIESRIKFLKDELTIDNLNFIKALAESAIINIENREILCVHGSPLGIADELTPNMDEEKFINTIKDVDSDIILTGHTHIAYKKYIQNQTIINPGSVGLCDRDDDTRASYGILEIDNKEVSFDIVKVDYRVEDEIALAVDKSFGYVQEYKMSLVEF